MKRNLNVLSIDFNDIDNAEMNKSFNGENHLTLKGVAKGKDEAIKKYLETKPAIVVINMVDSPANGLAIINGICEVVGYNPHTIIPKAKINKNEPPFFIACLNTTATNIMIDPYMGRISEVGISLPKYGDTQSVADIIDECEGMAEFEVEIDELGRIDVPREVMLFLELKAASPVYISQDSTRVSMRNYKRDNGYGVHTRKMDELGRLVLPAEIRKFLEITDENKVITLAIIHDRVRLRPCA